MSVQQAVYVDEAGELNVPAAVPRGLDLSGQANLQGHWPMNKATLSTDLGPNAYGLIGTGTPRRGPGRIGICYRSINTSNYVRAEGVNLRQYGAVTFGGWARIRSHSPAVNNLFRHQATGANENQNVLYGFQILDANTLRYTHEYGASPTLATATVTLTGMFELNEWFFLVGMRDSAGTAIKAQINGVTILDDTVASAPTGGSLGGFYPGSTDFYSVEVDTYDAFVISAELSESEATALYKTTTGEAA